VYIFLFYSLLFFIALVPSARRAVGCAPRTSFVAGCLAFYTSSGSRRQHQRAYERTDRSPFVGAIDEDVEWIGAAPVTHELRSYRELVDHEPALMDGPAGGRPPSRFFLQSLAPRPFEQNNEWRLSRCGVGPSVMKNWLPLVLGHGVGHIDSIPAIAVREDGVGKS